MAEQRTEETKIALVTGAGRGIGRATTRALLASGWSVIAVSRTEADLLETIDGNPLGVVFPGDVRDAKLGLEIQKMVRRRFGKLDALVNNAGIAPMRPFVDTGEKLLNETLAVNFTGPFTLTRHLWTFLTRRGGSIVTLSSKATLDPFPGFAAYAAAKGAVEAWTKALAVEGEKHKVTAYCVAPAGVETKMFRDLPITRDVPTDAVLKPSDVADVIASVLNGERNEPSGSIIRLEK